MAPAFSWSLLSQCSHTSTWLLGRLFVLLTTASNPVASLAHHCQYQHHPVMTIVTTAIITITIITVITAIIPALVIDVSLTQT